MNEIVWDCRRFAALTPDLLYKILALRQAVFVVEQKCAYADADGHDGEALHLTGWRGGLLVAYARILPPGVRYAEYSIGRVAVDVSFRGGGLGKAVMLDAMARIAALDAVAPIRIQAQEYLADGFYSGLGFRRIGFVYDEDGIPHVDMMFEPAK
jgi:ElaA protein